MSAPADVSPPPQAVLFVCERNMVRSIMAEALTKRRFAKRLWVESCGVRPGEAFDPMALAVLDEVGAELPGYRPRSFDDLDDLSFDLMVTLSPPAHHRALEFTRTLAVEVEYWPTPDPTIAEGSREQRLDEYRAVRDALDARIAKRFAMLRL